MSTTTTTAPRTKARPKPPRYARWLRKSADGGGILTLTVGKLTTDYLCTPLAADYGTAFRLEKFASQGGEVYDVNLDPEHGRCSCDCLGMLRWGHCKHIDSLLALTGGPPS
jgi:hypothetical protein